MDDENWRGAHLTVENMVVENWACDGLGFGPWSVLRNSTIQNTRNEGIIISGDYCEVSNIYFKTPPVGELTLIADIPKQSIITSITVATE